MSGTLLSTMTAIDQAEASFTYDSGKITTIDPAGPAQYGLTVDGGGALQSITDPDSRTHSFGYDAGLRLTTETKGGLGNQWHTPPKEEKGPPPPLFSTWHRSWS